MIPPILKSPVPRTSGANREDVHQREKHEAMVQRQMSTEPDLALSFVSRICAINKVSDAPAPARGRQSTTNLGHTSDAADVRRDAESNAPAVAGEVGESGGADAHGEPHRAVPDGLGTEAEKKNKKKSKKKKTKPSTADAEVRHSLRQT